MVSRSLLSNCLFVVSIDDKMVLTGGNLPRLLQKEEGASQLVAIADLLQDLDAAAASCVVIFVLFRSFGENCERHNANASARGSTLRFEI